MSEQDFQAAYSKNWSFPWQMYRDVFIFARDNKIPMIALNIPKPIAAKVARQGFASLSAEERKDLPPGITCELQSKYTELLQRAFGQVFKHIVKDSRFTYFCESQTLRNTTMAWNIARYLKVHPDRKVVAICGIWHGVKDGAPGHLPDFGTYTVRVILPEIPELNPQNTTLQETDYLVRKGSAPQ
jgi:uncharacterized iron-regulated protein